MTKLLAILAGALLCASVSAQTTITVPAHQVTVPVPAVTPAPVTPPPVVLSALGQNISLQPPAVQPPPIPATTITYQEPAYTITVAPPVTPAPVVTLSADPASIQAGGSSALVWSATNAISCTSAAFPVTVSATSGSLTIVPAATTSYSVSCTGVGGTGTASTTVTVTQPAPTTVVIGSLAPAGSPTSIATSLGTWTVPGGVVTLNGAAFGYSAGVVLLAWNGTAVYQENASCLWWVAGGTAAAPTWTASSAPAGITLPACSTPPPVTPPPVTPPVAGTTIFSFPNGFASASNGYSVVPYWGASMLGADCIPAYNGTAGHQAGTCAVNQQLDISKGFTATFDFTDSPMTGSVTAPSITGWGFVLQNSLCSQYANCYPYGSVATAGVSASGDANMNGFGDYGGQNPIRSAVAIKFDADPTNGEWSTQAFPSVPTAIAATGMYINGGPLAATMPDLDMAPYGINFYSGHRFHGVLTYDTVTLTLVLADTVSKAQYRTSWPLALADFEKILGGTKAWLSTTAGIGPNVTSQQHIQALTWAQGFNAELGAPTLTAGGSFNGPQTVTLSAAAGASIYYTTNGLVPTSASQLYGGPIPVAASTIIQAIAIEAGYTDSAVSGASYWIGGAPTLTAPGLITTNGSAYLAGGKLTLTDNQNAKMINEAGSAWSPLPMSVSPTVHSSFTLQYQPGQGGCMGFGFQNIPMSVANPTADNQWLTGGPGAVANASGCGFSGQTGAGAQGQLSYLQNSAFIKIDGAANTVGFYLAGQDPTQNSIAVSGVTVSAGNPVLTTVAYDGANLALTLTDTKTNGTFSHTWTSVNLQAAVGGASAYVGFTAGAYAANQSVSGWTFGP